MRQTAPRTRTFFGHPQGLANLFGVELWERFSFYGMLSILGYYLYHSVTEGALGLPKSTGVGIVGAYGGVVYLCTVFGGWASDRLLGMERTVFYGGAIVMAGHIALAVLPGLTGVGVGLALVALGSGALKANASALLGTLYERGDPRCDSGFTLFYLGVNIGAFAGPLLTGLLQTEWGYHYGFGAAAVGMAAGLTQYVLFRRNLGDAGREVPNPLPRNAAGPVLAVIAAAVAVFAAGIATDIVRLDNAAYVTVAVLAAISAAYFWVMLTSGKVGTSERAQVYAFIPLFLANAVFWSLFQQIFTVLAVYSEERVNWAVLGWNAPASWMSSIEPVWVIALSPLFAILWTRLGDRAPATPHKFAAGVIGMGAAFLLFIPLAGFSGRSVPILVIAAILGVFAVAELMLSPTGLAVTTQLAPQAFRAQMMALYFFSVGIGTSMAGILAGHYDSTREQLYFGILGLTAVASGVVVAALSPWIIRHMGDAR